MKLSRKSLECVLKENGGTSAEFFFFLHKFCIFIAFKMDFFSFVTGFYFYLFFSDFFI